MQTVQKHGAYISNPDPDPDPDPEPARGSGAVEQVQVVSVMRLALGTPAPARFMTRPISQPLMPLPSSGLGGALVSATSRSPLGSRYSQRGWSSSLANAATRVPGAATGVTPNGQPLAGAILTVGINDRCGAGRMDGVAAATCIEGSGRYACGAGQAGRCHQVASVRLWLHGLEHGPHQDKR